MATFQGNGVSLYYETRGSGRPVVFVHGTLCDYRSWSAQVEGLSSGYKTVAYSRRYAFPNAREGDATDSTVQNNAADLAALVKGLGLEGAHVVGHSYGGFISAYFATQYPELLRSLTLINAAVAPMLISSASPAAQLGLLLRSPGVALSARRLLAGTIETIKEVQGGDPQAANRVFLPALENGRRDLPPKPAGFAGVVAANARTLKETTTKFPALTRREAGGIRAPTLVVWGDLSAPWDAGISQVLSESIPGAESSVIRGAGHFCLNEKPAEVNERLGSFLARHS